jgi:hypothetical protein
MSFSAGLPLASQILSTGMESLKSVGLSKKEENKFEILAPTSGELRVD